MPVTTNTATDRAIAAAIAYAEAMAALEAVHQELMGAATYADAMAAARRATVAATVVANAADELTRCKP